MDEILHLPIGYILQGSYRIDSILGQGGFGITYLGTDLTLDRKIAIKEFFPNQYCRRDSTTSHVSSGTDGSKELVEQLKVKFLKEARNIARFNCPYIIRIYAAFEANNTAYYVMEYIEGEDLREIVEANGPLFPAHAVEYIQKIGEAVEYIHRHRMNHLDIKPSNVMVRKSDDTPILIDFGLSKHYDSHGRQTSTTPTGLSHGYAPIEQYRDGGVSEFAPQTDIYSLGATLYYLLCGETPRQAVELVDEPLDFPAGFPDALKAPIAHAMEVSKARRHESIGRFLEELPDLSNATPPLTPTGDSPEQEVDFKENAEQKVEEEPNDIPMDVPQGIPMDIPVQLPAENSTAESKDVPPPPQLHEITSDDNTRLDIGDDFSQSSSYVPPIPEATQNPYERDYEQDVPPRKSYKWLWILIICLVGLAVLAFAVLTIVRETMGDEQDADIINAIETILNDDASDSLSVMASPQIEQKGTIVSGQPNDYDTTSIEMPVEEIVTDDTDFTTSTEALGYYDEEAADTAAVIW